MARALGWVMRMGLWLAALLLACTAIVAAMRWTAVGDDERVAMALVDVPPAPLSGRNGFAALMLSGHDVPPERLDAVLAGDIAAFTAWHAAYDETKSFWATEDLAAPAPAGYSPLADSGFAERPPLPPADDTCALSAPGCLAAVRDREAATADLVHEHADRLASIEQALAADHLANPYPETMSTPMPPYASLRLPLTAAALDAVQGRAPQAYARTCGLLAAARRMDRQGGNLVEKLVAQSLAEGAAWLLLDLRRTYPVAALPAACAAALAPVGIDEAMVCEAMRGEYRTHRALGAQLDAQLAGWNPKALLTRLLLFDAELQAVWSAREFAPYCTEAARELADAGQPPPPPPPAVAFDRPVCYAAYINCLLAQISGPAFIGYADRSLDHAAKLRLLIAAQAVADGTATAANAAAAASIAAYPVDFDPATQTASVRLRAPPAPDQSYFFVEFAGLAPAPPSRYQPVTDGSTAIAARD